MKKSVAITISDERLAALEMSRNSLPAETEKLSEQ